jgi:putative DNA primase/helicase
MASERFGAAELHGSWANIRNDIPAGLIENTGQFKELIAGDPIKVEKKRKDPFMMEPTAKHLFSANELPDTETDDQAFYRRIILAAFPTTVPRSERDPTLPDRLEDEHPGILNWALDGLQRLLSNGGFTGDRSPARTEDTWAKWGNSVERFAKACLEDEEDNKIPTSEMFQIYLAYCDSEGIPAETVQQIVTKTLQGKTEYLTERKYIDGSQVNCFLDVGLTSRGVECRDADSDDSSAASGLNSY